MPLAADLCRSTVCTVMVARHAGERRTCLTPDLIQLDSRHGNARGMLSSFIHASILPLSRHRQWWNLRRDIVTVDIVGCEDADSTVWRVKRNTPARAHALILTITSWMLTCVWILVDVSSGARFITDARCISASDCWNRALVRKPSTRGIGAHFSTHREHHVQVSICFTLWF